MKLLAASPRHFRLADTIFKSIAQVTLPLAASYGKNSTPIFLDVIPADMPALLGMKVLDRKCLAAETVASRLTKVNYSNMTGSALYYDEWHKTLYRSKRRQVYAKMYFSADVMFTRFQLHKLHRQFSRPPPEKLFDLPHKSRPEESSPEIFTILQDLTTRYDHCQHVRSTPTRTRVLIGAEIVRFNEHILLDTETIKRETGTAQSG